MAKFQKKYPHEKLLASKQIAILDLDEDLQEQITHFDAFTKGVYEEKFVMLSEEIVAGIQYWLDSVEDLEAEYEVGPETDARTPAPLVMTLPEVATPGVVVPKTTVTLPRMDKDNRALLSLWEAGKTTDLTKADLKEAGFETSFFWSKLSSKGYKSRFFHLIRKSLREEIYSLQKLS